MSWRAALLVACVFASSGLCLTESLLTFTHPPHTHRAPGHRDGRVRLRDDGHRAHAPGAARIGGRRRQLRRACGGAFSAAPRVPPPVALSCVGQGGAGSHQAAPKRAHHPVSSVAGCSGFVGAAGLGLGLEAARDPCVAARPHGNVRQGADRLWIHPPRPHSFLKEHQAVASNIADFLCVKDRLHFLHTHKCVVYGVRAIHPGPAGAGSYGPPWLTC